MPDTQTARAAGLLYLLIIVLGLSAEIVVRQPLLALDAAGAAEAIAAGEMAFRLSIAADAVMVAADIALAFLLYVLLAPAGPGLAALAALFRLAQASVIASNLSTQYEALLFIDRGLPDLAVQSLELHGAGYDFGLIFFGINSVLTGILLVRHTGFPRPLGWLIGAAGAVYLTGSGLRLLAPDLVDVFAPAYLVAVLAETAFAVTLLRAGSGIARAAGSTREKHA